MKNPFDNADVIDEWVGSDGHAYVRLETGEIGHLSEYCLLCYNKENDRSQEEASNP